jgi:SAM-dependent methyltransferase
MAFEGARPSGRVITFGVQSVAPDAAGRRTDQEALFRGLGFDSVESIDFYDAEKPTHVLDLNRPVPAELHGLYDLVYDGGTTEHCFAAAEALSNALRLAKPGGRIIHHLPVNNWIDHGFYQFSPTLFFDFYGANGCEALSLLFHFMDRRRESFIAYEAGDFGRLPSSFGGKSKVLAFFSARKARSAQAGQPVVFPIQGRYRSAFGAEADGRAKRQRGLARLRRSLAKRTYRWRAKSLS